MRYRRGDRDDEGPMRRSIWARHSVSITLVALTFGVFGPMMGIIGHKLDDSTRASRAAQHASLRNGCLLGLRVLDAQGVPMDMAIERAVCQGLSDGDIRQIAVIASGQPPKERP